MDIYTRDKIIVVLQNEMQRLSNQNLKNTKRIVKNQNENRFLEEVVSDYKKYNEQIIELKNQQKRQIEYLLSYIEKALAEAGITETQAIQAKYERKSLLQELDNIKYSLNDLLER